jgi:hypothetical protein
MIGKFQCGFRIENFIKEYLPMSVFYTFYLHPVNIDARREKQSPCQWVQWVCAVFPVQYSRLQFPNRFSRHYYLVLTPWFIILHPEIGDEV